MATMTPSGTPAGESFSFLRPPAEPGELGRLGAYRVLRLLGAGGMGKVFLAEDPVLEREVALKVMCLPPGEDRAVWCERFLREARALAGINHPHLVTVYQIGDDNGAAFLAMERLRGESLDARLLRAGALSADEVLGIAEDVALGLAAIHDHGLIHRDIKPSNIWLPAPAGRDPGPLGADAPARAKILDFGLVRGANSDTHLTQVGVLVGTPAYMSLEQMGGGAIDCRSDLFSFGCVMYAMCTGRPPFAASNPVARIAALVRGHLTPVREIQPAVPEPLARLIEQLLATDPDKRPPSAAEVVRRLRAIRTGPAGADRAPAPFLRRHRVKLVALVAVLAATALLARATWPPRAESPVASSPVTPPDLPPAPDGGPRAEPQVPPAAPVVEYLCDMTKLHERTHPPPGGRPPPGVDGVVRVGGVRAPHGVFMHATPSRAEPAIATYKLDRKYLRFTAEVAMNDSARRPEDGPLVFTVAIDGEEKWRSRELAPRQPPERCDLDVRGANELTIGVQFLGARYQGAHGAWIEPHLTR
ncbi:protein kinase domain-containing protein [Frigoriglobus tundricola]|nr:protein kinase [Frigoriglobus tundricola]